MSVHMRRRLMLDLMFGYAKLNKTTPGLMFGYAKLN
jgi:hypothetical protein